ncbi:MAG: hypothetical protein FWF46_05935 [Oscillospiraceae bacterium]|nr:hypothetical protein [Oscillospiraceae bacterium]
MLEIYKEIKKTKDIERLEITTIQAVAFAMKAFENLRKAGNTYIDIDLFGSYMLTIMKIYIPDSIEKLATDIFEEHKKNDIRNVVLNDDESK